MSLISLHKIAQLPGQSEAVDVRQRRACHVEKGGWGLKRNGGSPVFRQQSRHLYPPGIVTWGSRAAASRRQRPGPAVA
jgi:hypothetical protein